MQNQIMKKALRLAKWAEKIGEVPIGCIITKDDKIISIGINLKETTFDATSHAEVVAIQRACKKLKTWRLTDCVLYSTLEPCIMCSGAIVQARISSVFFGALDRKGGGLKSLYEIHCDKRLNHQFDVTAGVLEDDCGVILSQFFKRKRLK